MLSMMYGFVVMAWLISGPLMIPFASMEACVKAQSVKSEYAKKNKMALLDNTICLATGAEE